MKRREFITLLGGAAAWPLAANAQQGERGRRIGVLMSGDETEAVAKILISGFAQALADFGWSDGRNVRTFGGAAVTPIGYERSQRSWLA
jgi:putative ABC transport system substrate-binding protein